MQVDDLGGGLWTWTVPHPEWTPDKDRPGWAQRVASAYVEAPGEDHLVLIDPLLPIEGSADAQRFWALLDADLARSGRHLAVLLSCPFHARSTARIRERMAGVHVCDVWALPPVRTRLGITATCTMVPGERLPGGIVAHEVEGVEAGKRRCGSRRGAPCSSATPSSAGVAASLRSWAPEGRRRAERTFRASLRRLLDLPVETLIPSHGRRLGVAALAAALMPLR